MADVRYRVDFVRSTPSNRRSRWGRGMTVCDPERPFRPQPIHRFNWFLGCDEAALAGSDATLDGERGPCNKASFRRREIEDCCRDFRCRADAFQGIPIRLLDEV